MAVPKKRALLIALSMMITFVIMRMYLHAFPGTNLDIAGYNIHHLYTGFLLVLFTSIPLVLFQINNRIFDTLCIGFGIGLSLILDEWVYLITTDGSDSSYLLPISLWGGVIMIIIAVIYTLIIYKFNNKNLNE